MLERDGYPAGVPCWVDTAQPDPAAAVEFYGGLFGWEFEDRMPADCPSRYFVARLSGRDVAAVGSAPEGRPATPVWNTYVRVDNADETTAKVTAAGGLVITPPFDVLDAGRMAVLADPAGATFCVWQARNHGGAQLVNQPGTWNWSDLSTSDLEGAKAFYGTVFGWETATIGFGTGESVMWRRPGYADFLEQIDPGIRQRHADAGAPEGFSDAIGWAMPTDEDIPPHWGITFAVDDTDAVAGLAEKLGGNVTVPPYDLQYARVAVVTDPQGAAFTVSRYLPPA